MPLRTRGAFVACILNAEYSLLIFLLTAYHLFIRHYIFKDHIGRNDVPNKGYGRNLDIFWLGEGGGRGGVSHIAGGKVC